MKIALVVLGLLLFTGCASGGSPKGAIAGCGDFQYAGTFTKSETSGRALWLSDGDLASRLTVADVIELATTMGCSD